MATDVRELKRIKEKRKDYLDAHYKQLFAELLAPDSLRNYTFVTMEKIRRCLKWYGDAWDKGDFRNDPQRLQAAHDWLKIQVSLKDIVSWSHLSKDIQTLCEHACMTSTWELIFRECAWGFILPFKTPVKFAIDDYDFQGVNIQLSYFQKLLLIYRYHLALDAKCIAMLEPLARDGFVPAQVELLQLQFKAYGEKIQSLQYTAFLSEKEKHDVCNTMENFINRLEKIIKDYKGIRPDVHFLLAEVYLIKLSYFPAIEQKNIEEKMIENSYKAYFYAKYLSELQKKGYENERYLNYVKQLTDRLPNITSEELIEQIKEKVLHSLSFTTTYSLIP